MRTFESPAYSKVNAQVFGEDLKQMGMATIKQVEKLALILPKGGKLLDLGCGAGQITKWFAEKLQCEAVGIDLDDEAISYATAHNANAKIEYKKMDFLDINLPNNDFSIVLSIDTLYFCKSIDNIHKVLSRCIELLSDNGIIAVFWENCPATIYENKTNTPQGTPIGKWANEMGYRFETIDFSSELMDFWKSWRYFEDSKDELIAEIGEAAFAESEQEFKFMISYFEKNPNYIGRWLFLIHK